MVGQNFIPSSSRPSALAAAVAQAHQMGNTQLVGTTAVLFLHSVCRAVFKGMVYGFNPPPEMLEIFFTL